MQLNDNTLLVGIKLNQKLRNHLDANKASVKHLLSGNNSRSLQIQELDSEDYITKTIKSGASLEEFNNICTHFKSMLKLIFPQLSLKEDTIKVYARPPSMPKNAYSGTIPC